MRRASLASLLALLPLLYACPAEEPGEPYELRAVVAPRLAELEAQVAAERPPAPAEVDPADASGLATMLANSRGRERELPLADIRALGDGAAPLLREVATRASTPADERLAACELLGALASERAAQELIELVEFAPESWVRSHAAWRLSETRGDFVVARLIKRLKYEKDHEVAIWIANALATRGNYSALVMLRGLQVSGVDEGVRAAAAERLSAIATGAGFEGPDALIAAWNGTATDAVLPRRTPSLRLVREAWLQIAELSGEHFQLRGVDEARWMLSNLGAWAVEPLCEALSDEDVYVRLHVAQCLERMGPRAAGAKEPLRRALRDPSVGPAAALALGAVGAPGALDPLCGVLTRDHPLDLRVAAAQALGRLGRPEATNDLGALRDDPEAPGDLRQTAAASGLWLGDEGSLPFLLVCLEGPDHDPGGAEVALAWWLASAGDERWRALSTAWAELDPTPGVIPTAAEVAERRAARARLLRAEL